MDVNVEGTICRDGENVHVKVKKPEHFEVKISYRGTDKKIFIRE